MCYFLSRPVGYVGLGTNFAASLAKVRFLWYTMFAANRLAGVSMLTKLFLVIVLGAVPWGGIWFPSTTGLAMGLRLPVAIGLSTAGQFGGVLAVLGAVSKAEKHPKVSTHLRRVRTERVRHLLHRYGPLGVPIAVIVLGAYAVTAAMATLGMAHRRILISVSLSLLMLAAGLYFLFAVAPLG
jgi:hypothetical protein